jgi:hypothetical protein
MSRTRQYLTKSRFKLATECPAKLYYTGKPDEYADNKRSNEFLKSLAEGGYQVGELAKLMFPGGVEVTVAGHQAQLDKTRDLLAHDDVVLFEPALSHDRLFARVDVLEKRGKQIRLIEVKSKSYDPLDEGFFRNTKGQISSGIRPYLLDIAFQTHVARQAMPGHVITPYLLVPDKSKAATVDGLNQMFPIERLDGANGNIVVRPKPGLTLNDVGTPVLTLLNVEEYVNEILTTVLEVPGAAGMLPELTRQWVQTFESDTQVAPSVGAQCKGCEFRAPADSPLKSGLKECWSKVLHLSDDDLAQPLVLDLWDGRGVGKWMGKGVYRLKDLSTEDIAYKPDASALTRTHRQWLQVSGEGLEESDHIFYADLVREQMAKWTYPLNLIDFETSRTALTFHKGGKPFDLVAFQFSHHLLHEDGRIEHRSEFLSTQPNQHPNLDFLRALKEALSGNAGSVMMWSPYENSVLNGLIEQLEYVGDRPADADELIQFAKSITVKKEGGKLARAGSRAMFDLCDIAKTAFFHKSTNASSSIKKVLPAMLQASAFLRAKYCQPIYGGGRGNSKNFHEPMTWWQADENGLPIDPYRLLPPVFSDLSLEDSDEDSTLLNQGGAAIMAYARLQFEDISDTERQSWERALLKYCELDTLAMAMIIEGWRDWVGR